MKKEIVATVKTEDCSMDYVRFGKGERTLVILPGLSVQSVTPAAEAIAEAYGVLAEDFTVYLFDRRSDLPDPYPIRQAAEDTAGAIAALGLTKIALYGVSQGGMIAQQLAILHPDLVDALILGSTTPYVDGENGRAIGEWVKYAKAGDAEGLYLAFGEAVYPEQTFLAAKDSLIAAAGTVTKAELERFVILAEGCRGFDLRAELRKIGCPTYLFGSKDDRVLGIKPTERIAAAFAGREDFSVHYYEGYGHASYDLAPDCKERILAFLTEDRSEN